MHKRAHQPNAMSLFVDRLEEMWDSTPSRQARSVSLVATLLGGVALIEAGRWAWPTNGPEWLPRTHLAAISWAIGLLLLYELVEMAFAISKSVSISVARHIQLYALVLLRDAFLKLDSFTEPIKVETDDLLNVAIMGSDAAGGVLLFIGAAVFARLQRHAPITSDVAGGARFQQTKHVIVLLLLATLGALIVWHVLGLVGVTRGITVLDAYFTVLVFVDVLLAFVSLAFTTNPAIVFRNFGFAFSAILLRFALASPEFIRPSLGVAGAITAIVMTLAYNLATDVQAHHPKPADPNAPQRVPKKVPHDPDDGPVAADPP